MDTPASSAAAPGPEAPAATSDATLGVGDALRSLWDDARGALTERVQMLLLEVRLAGLTLLQVVIYAVVIAVLVVTSWLLLVGGVVYAFMSLGLHWAVALAIAIASNLVVAGALVWVTVRLVERVGLPASLRRFDPHHRKS
jgi:hypothetical protein